MMASEKISIPKEVYACDPLRMALNSWLRRDEAIDAKEKAAEVATSIYREKLLPVNVVDLDAPADVQRDMDRFLQTLLDEVLYRGKTIDAARVDLAAEIEKQKAAYWEKIRAERQAASEGLIPIEFRKTIMRSRLPRPAAFDRVMAWAKDGTRRNLICIGDIGTGKTRAVYARLETMIQNGEAQPGEVCAIPAPTLADILRKNAFGDYEPDRDGNDLDLDAARQSLPILFIDDLTQISLTDRLAEDLFSIIDGRYRNSLCTVITSQADGEILARKLSRGRDEMLLTARAIVRRLAQDGECYGVNFDK